MKRSKLTSEALARWTCKELAEGNISLARQELPDLDVSSFLVALSKNGVPENLSLALVGFGVALPELGELIKKARLSNVDHAATDLHKAAAWRNNRAKHPVIVAYARGTVTGVNTLRHFQGPSSRDLAVELLTWALKEPVFTATEAHKRLLEQLAALVQSEETYSFEQVRAFLETWSETKPNDPRSAITSLGILPDPNLFADASLIRDRLEENTSYMAALRDRSPGHMSAQGKRLRESLSKAKGKDVALFEKLLKIFGKLQDIRRSPTPNALTAVTLDDALKVFRPPKLKERSKPEDEPKDPTTLNPKQLQQSFSDALLDNREAELVTNAEALSQELRSALDGGEDGGDGEWKCEVTINGDVQTFKGLLDRGFVAWVRHFCTPDSWGGLIETPVADLKRALEDFDRPETLQLNPEKLEVGPNGDLSMSGLLAGWDEDLEALGNGKPGLVALWEKLKSLRQQLLGCLEELTHMPLEWFAGKSNIRHIADEYLATFGQLFGLIGRHFGQIFQHDGKWAKTTLDALLALDVVQVRTSLPSGKKSSKAVLLPTHPLHLWRYWRLSNLLRGLGKDLSSTDRKELIEEVSSPIQFLSVIYASPLPEKKGAAQVLPVSNDLYSLATFENLTNAYSGPDGQEALFYAVERFAATHRLHLNPLRLVIVNPPQAGLLLLDLLRLLDGRKKLLVQKLRVEIRGTPPQQARLKNALLFDTREREIIEEKISSGRLELAVDREAKPLAEILSELHDLPAHIVAVFDEAPVSVRRGGAGQNLPMSPFCVRRKVAFHRRWNELRLEPVAGAPPFFEFIELIKHAEGNEGEGTPYAWPEAQALRESVDGVLAPDDFGAQWFFLADRALPEEGSMKAQRLLRRREGQRQVLLATRDYGALARLILPVFEADTPNLLMPASQLNKLLSEGAHLIGAGLLDLFTTKEGSVVPSRVIGLMGTLLAARDFLRRHPGALLVSTDSQLARKWLRLGLQDERCDLLGVYEANGKIFVECIEVKTTKGAPRDATDPQILEACKQVSATLGAVSDGLGDTVNAEKSGHFLAAPRNEMIKEVLVQGCMGRFATKEERSKWSEWLSRLFGPNPESPQLVGAVVDVALGSAETRRDEEVAAGALVVTLRHLNENDVQGLLEDTSAKNDQRCGSKKKGTGYSDALGEDGGELPRNPTAGPAGSGVASSDSNAATDALQSTDTPPFDGEQIAEQKKTEEDTFAATEAEQVAVNLGKTKDGSTVLWKPSVRGNPHLMVVGLPGMGKTTCLINICKQLKLQGVAPIVFSYHDDIDDQLAQLFPGITSHDCRALGFNPMRIVEPGRVAHVESAGQLRDIFAAIFSDLGDLQLEDIRSAIKQSYEAIGWGGTDSVDRVPEFGDFLQRLRQIRRPDKGTKTMLARLAELDDFGFFSGGVGKASLLDSPVPRLIRIHDVSNEVVQRAYASFVLYRVYQDMFRRGRQDRLTHAVVFDEAHKASRLKLLPVMAKECRKYGISLIVASQETRDFDDGLFAAIANYVVLRLTDVDARAMARHVARSGQERRYADLFKNLAKFEAVFFAEGQTKPAHVMLSHLG